MRLALPDVTLCAVTCINHELTVRSMLKCLEQCSFADVVLLTDKAVDAPFRVEVIPTFEGHYYSPMVCRNLTHYTASSHNLLVQYDSYITEPAAWNDAFLDYDYIGAKWPWHPEGRRVGNSGFCLRSKKLLDMMAEMPLPPAGQFVDDTYFCHTIREPLEKVYGVKFAPEEVADQFSYERHRPDQPTFGFHGIFNFWRHTDDAEMAQLHTLLDDVYVPSRAFAEVLFYYHDTRKFPVFRSWYQRLRSKIEPTRLKDHLLQYLHNPEFIEGLIASGEKLAKEDRR